MKKNVASQSIGAQMVATADGTAFTSAVTIYVTGDNGVQAVGSVGAGACTHEGNGYHSYAPAQAETNYNHIAFTFIGTGAVPATVQVFTSFPQTGDSYEKVDTEVATLVTGVADIQARLPAALTGDGNIKADTLRVGGTLQTAGDIPALVTTVDTVVDAILVDTAEIGAAGAGLTAINLPNQTMDIVGNITGNLSGSVGSVTGAVGSVTAGVTLAASAVQAIWDALTAALTTVGSIGKLLVDRIDAAISSRLASASYTSPLDAAGTRTAVGLAAANLDTQLDAIPTAAEINAEVVDALNVDTYAEPAQGTPAATTSLAAKLNYMYKSWRNKKTQTATTYSLFNDDAATVDHKATVSDDGVTATKGEITTGP